jgi:thiol-disulfide isomerase/thioredoxin
VIADGDQQSRDQFLKLPGVAPMHRCALTLLALWMIAEFPVPRMTARAAEPDAAARAAVKLSPATWDEVQKVVAGAKGRVVVLDVWSTACQPCMEEFPHLVKLQNQQPDTVCISLSVDYAGIRSKPPEYYRERVETFLSDQKAGAVKNYLCSQAADDLFEKLDLDSIPAVYVYGRDGKLAKRFDNRTPAKPGSEGISYETQVLPLVDKLVKLR